MTQQPAIYPVTDCQAYLLVSMIGMAPSKNLTQLLRRELVKGIVLTKDNVYDQDQFFQLIRTLRSIRSNLIILVDVDVLIQLSCLCLSQRSVHKSEQYIAELSDDEIKKEAQGNYAITEKLISLCELHQLIPKFVTLIAKSGDIHKNIKNIIVIQKLLINTLIEKKYYFHCSHQIKQQLIKPKSIFDWRLEEKNSEKIFHNIKVFQTHILDDKSYQEIDYAEDNIQSLTIFFDDSHDFNQDHALSYALRIGEMSCYVDLIEIPELDEGGWTLLSDQFECNPRLAVDEKLKKISCLDNDIEVVDQPRRCCGFF